MKKIVLMGLLLLLFGIIRAQHFNKAEYFIDTDPGIGLSTNTVALSDTSDTASVNLNFNVPLTQLGSGFHKLGFRILNKNGIWSIAESQSFFIFDNIVSPSTPSLASYEYFIDVDSGIGKGIKGTLADTANKAFSILLSGISPGFHILGVRVANSNNQWSINETRNFYVYSTTVTTNFSKISNAEYFIDKDPGIGKGKPITAFTAFDSVSLNFTVPLDTLQAGFHLLSVRVKDSSGIWGNQESKSFYIYQPKQISLSSPLVYLEYFIDADPGKGSGISMPVNKGDSIGASVAIDVSKLSLGNHVLTVRAKDSSGIWSISETKSFSTCTSLVTPDFSVTEDCAQSPIAMNNFSTGTLTGASFQWDFESDGKIDTTTLNASVFNKKFPVGGTYNITLTVTDNAKCTATISHSLIIDNQPPAPSVIPSGTVTFCPGSLGVLLTSSIHNIVWSPTNDTTVSILAGNTGNYFVTATDPNTGCSINSNVVSVVKGSLKPGFNFSVNPINKRVNFTDASVGGNKWLWRFGDFATGTGHTPFHIYSQSGAYRVCQSAFDTINGCSADTCKLVRINVIDSTFAAFSYVQGNDNSISFTNLSSPNAKKFYWTYGNGNFDTVPNPKVNFTSPGIYDVCLRVFDPASKGNSQTCNKVSVGTVACKLNASYSYWSNPATNKVEFSDQSDGDLALWYWTFGDGSTSTSQSPDHQFAGAGFYLVTLSVSNGNNQCIDSYQEIVKVGNGNCKASYNYFVEGNSVSFTNNSTGSNLNYYWSFDDGTASTLLNPVKSYTKQGLYNVSLTITNAGGTCSDISVSQVLVGKVDCNATFSYYIDSVLNKVFFAPSSALPEDQLFWTFGDGSTDTSKTPSHEFPAPGYFNVGLSLYNASGCMDFQQQTLLIGREGIDCQSDFIYSVSGTNVNYTDISKGKPTGYLWNFGDGTDLDITANPAHTYNTGGYYNVCHLIVNKYGISNIKCKPVPVITTSQTNCYADFDFIVDQSTHNATFSNKSIGNPNQIKWTFGDKDTSNLSDPLHNYVKADYYLVGLKITNTTTGCSDKTYKIVNITNIQGKIKAGFGFDPQKFSTKAGGYPVDFIGAGLGDQSRLKWSFGDGSGVDSTTSTPVHIYANSGTYTVCYFISDPITGQKDSVCQDVSTKTLCADDAIPPVAICKNITVQLDGSGNASITPSMVDNGSADICTNVTLSIDKQAFTTADVGVNNVVLTVQDSSKNKSECTAQVTVEKSIIVETNKVSSGFEIYPNPVGSSTYINFELERETEVNIGLFDLEGKLLETIIKTQKPAGKNSILWNSSNLHSGAYIISFSTVNDKIERKMLIKQ